MFSSSSQLREIIAAARNKVQNELDKPISLVEYITLPDFGQHIVLRIKVNSASISLAEIDVIENQLRNLVGQDFWVTLAGSVYADIYPPRIYSELPERLIQLSAFVASTPVPVSTSSYARLIQKDADVIRAAIGNRLCKIWEIEIPVEEKSLPIIRIIGGGNDLPSSVTICVQKYAIEYLAENVSYENSLKAYVLSSQSGLSSLHYIVMKSDEIMRYHSIRLFGANQIE